MTTITGKEYYVYMLSESASNVPFYVGKGHGQRAASHHLAASTGQQPVYVEIRRLRGNGIDFNTTILHDGLTESEAFALEYETISKLGRRCTGDGPLVNRTLGGRGPNGFQVAAETKAKISQNIRPAMQSSESKALRSAIHSEIIATTNIRKRNSASISKKYDDPEYRQRRLSGLSKWAASGYSKMSIDDLLKIRDQVDEPSEIDNIILRKERYQHRKAKKKQRQLLST